MELNIYIPGIAPSGPPPPFPEVLYEDERLLVVNKPARMMAHPSGSTFVWSLIALARMRWSDREVDLVHRLDRDTSGALLITKDKQANHQLKAAMKAGEVHKEYTAICKGHIPWNQRLLDGRIGPAGGEIRIQMGVRDEGQSARTHVEVLARSTANCEAELTQVRCQIETGRTHQIRVHLAHAGFPLIGDRLYGVEPAVFLHALRHGADPWVMTQAGAPRHALHSSMLAFPHPDGTQRVVEAPLADDIASWWAQPHLLPLGRNSPTPSGPGD